MIYQTCLLRQKVFCAIITTTTPLILDIILQMVSDKLYLISAPLTDIDIYANQLLQIMQSPIEEHIPLAKPSFYSKRWSCKDLTALRKEYTSLRNRFHRAKRRNVRGNFISTIDAQAWAAKHAYFKALGKRKKEHWEDFLDNTENIRQGTKYPSYQAVKPSFSPIATIKDNAGSLAKNSDDIANVLLDNFFLPHPPRLAPTPNSSLSETSHKATL